MEGIRVYSAIGMSVFVDGVKVENAFKFNIAEGWVECFVSSPSKYCNQDVSADDVLSSRLYGVIEVDWEGK